MCMLVLIYFLLFHLHHSIEFIDTMNALINFFHKFVVRAINTLLNPLLYSDERVCRGMPIFLIFDPKYKLWVLHNQCFEQT